MPNPKKNVINYKKVIVNYEEAANFLNLSKSTFFRLIEAGIIPRSDDGNYILGEVVEAYWRNQFDSEGLRAAQTRLVTAQAELKEAELAEQRGELHRASVVQKIWSERNINIRAKLLAIPTKISPELVGKDLLTIQAKLKDSVNEALEELADYDAGRITAESLLAN